MKDRRFLKIWKFENAPEEYKKLSQNGGDEDWIVFMPDGFDEENEFPYFLDEGTYFACFIVEDYEVKGGKIRIGAHS